MFNIRIKELRESKSLTQKDLSIELNKLNINNNSNKIYAQTVSYWENGREPNIDTLIKLSNYFNVSIDYLLGNSNIKNSTESNLFEEMLPRQLITLFNEIKETYFYLENNISSDGINSAFSEYYTDTLFLINKLFKKFEESLLNYSNNTNKIYFSNFYSSDIITPKYFIDNDLKSLISNNVNNDLSDLKSYIPKVISQLEELFISYTIFINNEILKSIKRI